MIERDVADERMCTILGPPLGGNGIIDGAEALNDDGRLPCPDELSGLTCPGPWLVRVTLADDELEMLNDQLACPPNASCLASNVAILVDDELVGLVANEPDGLTATSLVIRGLPSEAVADTLAASLTPHEDGR